MTVSSRRMARERETIAAMIHLYCREQHHNQPGLCPECDTLQTYAFARLDRCPFADQKPTCANCTVHCYKPDMRTQIRQVMRFAGPRMLLHHPVLAVLHLLDGLRKPPVLEKKRSGG